MALLLDLPLEILQIIFSQLQAKRSQLNLLRVCSTIKAIVHPILVRKISLDLLTKAHSPEPYSDRPNGNLQLFYEAVGLFRREPHLARAVQVLEIRVHCESSRLPWADQDALLTLLPCLQALRLSPPPPTLDLTRCRNLTSLSIDFEEYSYYEFDSAPYIYDRKMIYKPPIWTTLPKLRTLELVGVPLDALSMPEYSPPVHISIPITDLSFFACPEGTAGTLARFVESFPNLLQFRFETYWPRGTLNALAHSISVSELGAVLEPYESTLASLRIRQNDGADFKRDSLFGNMNRFSSLTRLSLPDEFLVVADAQSVIDLLPASLQELELCYAAQYTSGNWDSHLDERAARMKDLAARRQSRLPVLWFVGWWWQSSQYWPCDAAYNAQFDKLRDLVKLFDAVDVLFSFTSDDFCGISGLKFRPNDSSFTLADNYAVPD